MIEIQGKYNIAKVFTDVLDPTTFAQILDLCNQEFLGDSNIRIMPDTHAGKGCTIGTTMMIKKGKVVPNHVGVDIGCGVLTVELGQTEIDLPALDDFIRGHIPSGFSINECSQIDHRTAIASLRCGLPKSVEVFNRALGSLGGGNHFIEVDVDSNGDKYLLIHTGSRNLGNVVAGHYQDRAYAYQRGWRERSKQRLIEGLRTAGRSDEIATVLAKLKLPKVARDMCYLEDAGMDDYLHDMRIIQEYADVNRSVIARRITEEHLGLRFDECPHFQTIHNYIDIERMILRKGAISALEGETVLIPINMRDGSLICVGKGNPDWNYSAPHGAGRLMSRREAKRSLDMADFQEHMNGIYTTSVSKSTLDEAPSAYKPMEEILSHIEESLTVIKRLRPIYNFKAGNGRSE